MDSLELREGLECLRAVAVAEQSVLTVKGRKVHPVEIIESAMRRINELEEIVNTPENDDFVTAIVREREHQRLRWPKDHDEQKTDWDWFWLVGYLAQKAATADGEKRKHHIITTCAALMNWHERAVIDGS